MKGSGASKLLSNLVQADIIEPVSGHGKGKYKFQVMYILSEVFIFHTAFDNEAHATGAQEAGASGISL